MSGTILNINYTIKNMCIQKQKLKKKEKNIEKVIQQYSGCVSYKVEKQFQRLLVIHQFLQCLLHSSAISSYYSDLHTLFHHWSTQYFFQTFP